MPEADSRAGEDFPVLLFDGDCAFCHASVLFVLDHEDGPRLHFASQQSEAGKTLLERHGQSDLAGETVVLIEGGKTYDRSDATARVATYLRAPWSWLRLSRFVPRPLRELGYRFVARNRYRIMGTADACRVPAPRWQQRLLVTAEAAG